MGRESLQGHAYSSDPLITAREENALPDCVEKRSALDLARLPNPMYPILVSLASPRVFCIVQE